MPLLDEYSGACSATGATVPAELLHSYCNHGYANGVCEHLPSSETRSAVRFTIVARTVERIDLLCIEETRHEPIHWRELTFSVLDRSIANELADEPLRAQAQAFCLSLLARFPR